MIDLTNIYFCISLVDDYFNHDKRKTLAWFNTYNPHLCSKPKDMIALGREDKLLKFIQSALSANTI